MKWEPIETAPRDGTWILGWRKSNVFIDGVQTVMAFDDVEDHWVDGCFEVDPPTHWMPLPEPPK